MLLLAGLIERRKDEDMNEIETVGTVKPDPELMALTKRVMDQNDAILRMNGRLMDMLASPVLLVRGKDAANDSNERRR